LQIVLIAAGGAVGAVLRYLVQRGVHGVVNTGGFPLGTLVVNLSGCLLLGLLATYLQERTAVPVQVRLAVTVGVMGAYTTFSTFSAETLYLLETDRVPTAAAYVGLSVMLGVLGVWMGQSLARL